MCHADRAPRSKDTEAPAAWDCAVAVNKGSTRTGPLNCSAGPCWVERESLREMVSEAVDASRVAGGTSDGAGAGWGAQAHVQIGSDVAVMTSSLVSFMSGPWLRSRRPFKCATISAGTTL